MNGHLRRVEVRYVKRFDRMDRLLHSLLMLSFLGLAATGLPLLFSMSGWASRLSHLFGGFAVAGRLHRTFALLMIGVFLTHLGRIIYKVAVQQDYGLLWGPRSMVPQPRDVRDLMHHLLWFVGRGPRPAFERYTYWEKFDYWAVFWGMAIIGGSGLLLWFPEVFARAVPGWVFNIALTIHGEEALLAVGFIFTIHFFNGHLRPEKFPMDMVIFTGRLLEAELKHERPAEFERLQRTGELEDLIVRPPSERSWLAGRLLGTSAVLIGLTLVGLIIYAVAAYGL